MREVGPDWAGPFEAAKLFNTAAKGVPENAPAPWCRRPGSFGGGCRRRCTCPGEAREVGGTRGLGGSSGGAPSTGSQGTVGWEQLERAVWAGMTTSKSGKGAASESANPSKGDKPMTRPRRAVRQGGKGLQAWAAKRGWQTTRRRRGGHPLDKLARGLLRAGGAGGGINDEALQNWRLLGALEAAPAVLVGAADAG